jgi:hypothetical protein
VRPVYNLYGLNLASDFAFATHLAEGDGEPDLTFRLVDTPPATGWDEGTPAFASSPELDGVEESLVYAYRHGDYDVLRCTDIADYYLWQDRIVCHLLDPRHEYLAEIHLLGPVFSLWLELRGMPALHASAIVVEERAIVFLGTNKGGKSTLAASLVQAGYPLLTDDVLPVDNLEGTYVGRPSYPQMRMWPDQALHFLGGYEDLGIVHPAYSKRRVPIGVEGEMGTFREEPVPLGCVYLPERRQPVESENGIEINDVPRTEALMALIGRSFLPHTVEALGLQPQRLRIFTSLLAQVPVRRFVYPEGYDRLPEVRRALLDDLAGTDRAY